MRMPVSVSSKSPVKPVNGIPARTLPVDTSSFEFSISSSIVLVASFGLFSSSVGFSTTVESSVFTSCSDVSVVSVSSTSLVCLEVFVSVSLFCSTICVSLAKDCVLSETFSSASTGEIVLSPKEHDRTAAATFVFFLFIKRLPPYVIAFTSNMIIPLQKIKSIFIPKVMTFN